MKEKLKKAYNLLSNEYFEARKFKKGISYFYNNLLEMPTTLKLLGVVKGKKILDLGCGPGFYAKVLTNKGAKVRGIDISSESLKIAKKEVPKVEFILGDVEKIQYENSEFDIVLSALVLGHLKNWDNVFIEVNRVLKQKGIFVFSIHNPVTEKTVKTKWFFKKFRIIKNYFKEEWKHAIWGEKTKKAQSSHHHKTYGTIIKLLVKHGFEIIDYEDCKPIPLSKKLFPKEYEETINAPHFCSWKVMKK